MKKTSIFALFLCLHYFSQAATQEIFHLKESDLVSLSKQQGPDLESIEASFYMAEVQQKELNDSYKPELFAETSYTKTKEKALFPFMPVWSPEKLAQAGVRQRFKTGISTSATIGLDQRSATTPSGTYNELSTSLVRFKLELDLWKNLFGELGKAELNSTDYDSKRADYKRQVETKAFLIGLRKVYWNLVAVNERIKLSEALIKVAQAQLSDAQKRRSAGVSDGGEVARYEAQVASRNGSLINYQYAKEAIIKQLKALVPGIQTKQIELAPYNIAQTVDEVLSCSQLIAKNQSIPHDYTFYDEITQLLEQSKQERLKLASSYNDIDLKMIAIAQTKGIANDSDGTTVNGSYSKAVKDWQDNNRTGYTVGLQLTVPLGRGETENSKQILETKRHDAEIKRSNAAVASTHDQLKANVKLLAEIIRFQKLNKDALERRLQSQNRKFREARVSVNDIIQDQDSLLSSDLSIIDTQLEILNTLFDYLIVFTETPCEFNRI